MQSSQWDQRARRSLRLDLAAATGVTALVGALTVAAAAREPVLWHDSVEYIAIANAWANGAGFVDPVKWTYYLATAAPVPAFAVRAPVPAVLLALPLALGATLPVLRGLNAGLTSVVAGVLVLLARRMMSLPVAAACALMICLSDPWLLISRMPMSDLIAIGAMLLVFAASRRVSRSVGAALMCSAVTLLGWATRPTIALLVVPIAVAVAWDEGARAAWRSRGLRVYLGATLAGYLMIRQVIVELTGLSPYSAYGIMSEMLKPITPLSYGTKYLGACKFIWRWLPQIANMVIGRARQLFAAVLVTPRFGHVALLALPGVAYCLARRHPNPDQAALRRLVALSCLLFAATTILTYAAFDPNRYPLPVVVCGALCGFAWLDDMIAVGARALRARASSGSMRLPGWGTSLAVAALFSLPLTFVLAAFLQRGGLYLGRVATKDWSVLLRGAMSPPEAAGREAGIKAICSQSRPGVVVAARNPWMVHAWCGNPTIMLPIDLNNRASLQQAFLRHEQPSYVLGDGSPGGRWLATSPYLQRVAAYGALVLYEVSEPGSRRDLWRQPPPLMCAGRGESCLRAVGR